MISVHKPEMRVSPDKFDFVFLFKTDAGGEGIYQKV
jgi:hypothetical protein